MSEDSSDENSGCRVVPDPTGKYGFVIVNPADAVGQSELELLRAKLKLARDWLHDIAEFGSKKDRMVAHNALVRIDKLG